MRPSRTTFGVFLGACCVLAAVIVARPYDREALSYADLQSTRVLDRHGVLLDELTNARGGYGRWVSLDHIAKPFLDALIASEDANFYSHHGVDPTGIARAIILDFKAKRFAYGGSTITQQLSKMLHPRSRTLFGKLFEAVDAFRLEAHLSKREILEQYVNRAYFGRNSYGVDAAALRFFGKHASELSTSDAVLLATLPRAPSRYSPQRHEQEAANRRAHILSLMVKQHRLSSGAAKAAEHAPITLAPIESGREAPHALDFLRTRGVVQRGSADVTTTLDLGLQKKLETRVRTHLEQVRSLGIAQAGVIVVDNASGEVLAMIGSSDYDDARTHGAVNAMTAARHPGSTLKPFLYALAIEQGASPSTPVFDIPTTFRGYTPHAIDARYHGVVSMREALASSLNVPATRLANSIGPENFAMTLNALGMTTVRAMHANVSLPLGSEPVRIVDLAEGYATLARGGDHVPLSFIRTSEPSQKKRVFSPEAAFLVTSMLSDAAARRREFGLETPLDFPFEVAAKTGTSQAYVDDVVAGYSADVTVAVWSGNFDGTPTHAALAMDGAAPLFHDAMMIAMEGRTRHSFTRPDGIVTRHVCARSGMLAGPHCAATIDADVDVHHAPAETCTWHSEAGESLPPELRAMQTDVSASPVASAGKALQIFGVQDGAHFRIDPVIPAEAQQLSLRAIVRDPRVTELVWRVDGEEVARVHAPFASSIALIAGEHTIEALTFVADEQLRDAVSIFVSGSAGT